MNVSKNLSIAEQYIRERKFEKAEDLCRKILSAMPDNTEAAFLLGASKLAQANYAESIKIYEAILSKNPNHVMANNDLGVIFHNLNDHVTAEKYFKKVNAIDPSYAAAIINLANIALHRDQLDKAEELYKEVLKIQPNNQIIIKNLGQLFLKQNRITEGVELLKKILTLPDPGPTVFIAYLMAKRICQWEIADKFRKIIVDRFLKGWIGSEDNLWMLGLALLADPHIDNDTMFRITCNTANDYQKLCSQFSVLNHEKAFHALKTGAKLRIGYLSGDFYQHVATNFMRSIINYYDKDRFEVFCYSNTFREDAITSQYRSNVNGFIDIRNLSDFELARRIQEDGIHILVDLSGYTSGSRVSVMSYRAAPMQVNYLGYPYSTGFYSIDYILSDPYLDGPSNANYCSEKPLRLPEVFCAFGELFGEAISPEIAFEKNGVVTFGSLINTYKLTPEIIRAWSLILQQSDGARLILNHPNYKPEITRQNILNEFEKNGIPESRVLMIWEKLTYATHLHYYNDIDIALDLFPMTGGQTTVDALWMGVPVITLVGETHHQRISYTLLKNLAIDVDDIIAFNEDEYIQQAVALSKNKKRIKDLHKIIPEALSRSILCDPVRFSAQLEATYIEGWNKKYPDIPYYPGTRKDDVEFVRIRGDVELAVSSSIDDRFSYIVREQRGWFDSEYDFVLQMIKPDDHVIDINTEIGAYSVPMAKKMNGNGKVWAISTGAEYFRYLQKSKDHNKLSSLQIVNNVRMGNFNLDREMTRHGWDEIDFIRIHCPSGEQGLIGRGIDFFSRLSPLVMYGIKLFEVTSFFIEKSFKELNYDSYRLVPGINVLVPFDSSTTSAELDDFSMHLFCCKKDRAEMLYNRGLLLPFLPPTDVIPDFLPSVLVEYLSDLPYADGMLERWVNHERRQAGWEIHIQALSLFAASKTEQENPARKYGCIQSSLNLLAHLFSNQPNVSRVLSFARILMETGKRYLAINVLDHLAGFLETGSGAFVMNIDEPFLALSDSLAAINPGDRIAEWIYASILEQREKLRAFSSYYTGVESLDILNKIDEFGFMGDEMQTRRQLVRIRHRMA